MEARERIILALDVPTLDKAEQLVSKIGRHVGYYKIGLEFINSVGAPEAIDFVYGCGVKCFVDEKFCDIPNTVGGAVAAITWSNRVAMFNVMASGGIPMMMAAAKNKRGGVLALAVTVLTSLDEENAYTALDAPTRVKVLRYARDAKLAGMDGVICSPQELPLFAKNKELDGLLKVTPGVRPAGSAMNDQERVMTPYDAILAGADYLVIGRPISNPPQGTPVEAAERIGEEIEKALAKRAASTAS